MSGRAAAARLKLSAATGVRWFRKIRERGDATPDVQGRPKGYGKLAPHRGFLEELVAQDGDITLPELARALKAATDVVAHPAFEVYIRDVLAPELQPGTVVICDNLATHYNKAAAETLRDVGCWFLYLPSYSPDLNPIEMAFSKLKAHLRRIGARTFDQMFNALAEICDLFTSDECWNFFCEAGYGSG